MLSMIFTVNTEKSQASLGRKAIWTRYESTTPPAHPQWRKTQGNITKAKGNEKHPPYLRWVNFKLQEMSVVSSTLYLEMEGKQLCSWGFNLREKKIISREVGEKLARSWRGRTEIKIKKVSFPLN